MQTMCVFQLKNILTFIFSWSVGTECKHFKKVIVKSTHLRINCLLSSKSTAQSYNDKWSAVKLLEKGKIPKWFDKSRSRCPWSSERDVLLFWSPKWKRGEKGKTLLTVVQFQFFEQIKGTVSRHALNKWKSCRIMVVIRIHNTFLRSKCPHSVKKRWKLIEKFGV